MRMTAGELARAVRGTLQGDANVLVAGAEVDSRRLTAGDLFVALPGARRDGHEFVPAALAGAAAVALVRRDTELPPPPPGRALVRVDDPLAAYHAMARAEAARRSWKVAAVTGSVGKTTTKHFLAHLLACRFVTGASEGNRNSTLGLPAQLLRQPEDIEVFVAEMGMSHAGELDALGAMLPPDVLLYTRLAGVHLEFFADMSALVEAKAELLAHLDPDGTLVINASDPLQAAFPSRTRARTLTYGDEHSWGRLEAFADRGLLGSRFRLVLGPERCDVELPLAGLHQAENLLAAAVAAAAVGLDAGDVPAAAASLKAEVHRGSVHRRGDGVTVVDDSYNASPVAVQRMLELLAAAPGRRVAVLGEMYELGERTEEAHREVGRAAAAACDVLVAVGREPASALAAAARIAGLAAAAVHHVTSAEAAAARVTDLLEPGDVVLVKGSRGVGLDRTVAALLAGGGA